MDSACAWFVVRYCDLHLVKDSQKIFWIPERCSCPLLILPTRTARSFRVHDALTSSSGSCSLQGLSCSSSHRRSRPYTSQLHSQICLPWLWRSVHCLEQMVGGQRSVHPSLDSGCSSSCLLSPSSTSLSSLPSPSYLLLGQSALASPTRSLRHFRSLQLRWNPLHGFQHHS